MIFFLVIGSSCHKIDLKPPVNQIVHTGNKTIQKFFNTANVNDPLIDSIAEKIYRLEQKKPFVEEFVKYAGFPIWDKNIVSVFKPTSIDSLSRGKKGEGKVIFIPLALANDSTVNAILRVNITGHDATFKMLYRWQYKKYGYAKNEKNNNARKSALFFMGMESYVFDHSTFRIRDTLLFKGESSSDIVKIKSFGKPLDGARSQAIGMTICYQVECAPTYYVRPSSTYYCGYCETYWSFTDGGSGGGVSGGGVSGGGGDNYPPDAPPGTSGSGYGDGGWNDNPCSPLTGPGPGTRVKAPCGDEPAWEPVPLPKWVDNPPSEQELKATIQNRPFALFKDVPCEVLKAWLATAKHTVAQVLINKLETIKDGFIASPGVGAPGFYEEQIANVQKLDDAYSAVVNMDYFSVNITKLPVINGVSVSPSYFLSYIRKNINNFVNTDYSEFTPYHWYGINDGPLWNSNNPYGAVIAIDIKGPDNGSVIVSGSSNDKWTFTTIYEPHFGEHPVSGNRDFGYTYNADGSYTFYTRGVDRLTSWDGTFINEMSEDKDGRGWPLKTADKLWKSFQTKLSAFVRSNHGAASINESATQTINPKWKVIKDVLNGIAPLSVLSKDCN